MKMHPLFRVLLYRLLDRGYTIRTDPDYPIVKAWVNCPWNIWTVVLTQDRDLRVDVSQQADFVYERGPYQDLRDDFPTMSLYDGETTPRVLLLCQNVFGPNPDRVSKAAI